MKRSTHEMNRGMLVGVLFRRLKYHSGLCFITSNQALDTFDPAILSQLHLKVKYKEPSHDQKSVIFEHGLKQLGMTRNVASFKAEEVSSLLENLRNGRDVSFRCPAGDLGLTLSQIKNVLRLADAVAFKSQSPIDFQTLKKVCEAHATCS